MERVNHINIVKVGGRRLISDVYGVLERNVPYREGFKFRVSCLNAALVLVVKL